LARLFIVFKAGISAHLYCEYHTRRENRSQWWLLRIVFDVRDLNISKNKCIGENIYIQIYYIYIYTHTI